MITILIALIIGVPLICTLNCIYRLKTDKQSGLYLHKIHTPIEKASYKWKRNHVSYSFNHLCVYRHTNYIDMQILP